jgi:hypothetical protein
MPAPARVRGIDGFPEPTWESVRERRPDFDGWADERLVLDSMAAREDNLRMAIDHLTDASRVERSSA